MGEVVKFPNKKDVQTWQFAAAIYHTKMGVKDVELDNFRKDLDKFCKKRGYMLGQEFLIDVIPEVEA